MIGEYKVVIVTPAGRQRYLELLIPQVQNYKQGGADEYRLWVNTTDQNDIDYMTQKAAEDPDFIKLEHLTVPHNGSNSIYSFFKNCVDEKTVYVRLDDDIVLLDTPEQFKAFVEFRINHPEYFLVYGNILNNAILSHIHQKSGKLSTKDGNVGYSCMDDIGWKNGEFTLKLHEYVLGKTLSYFYFKDIWNLVDFERVSINCISWLGSEFKRFEGNVGTDEEQWLSSDKPRELNKTNCIYGQFVCVHYAFYTQRDVVDASNILELYKERIGQPFYHAVLVLVIVLVFVSMHTISTSDFL